MNDYLVAKQQDSDPPVVDEETTKLAFDVLSSSPKYGPALQKLAAAHEAQNADFSGRVLAHSFWAHGHLGDVEKLAGVQRVQRQTLAALKKVHKGGDMKALEKSYRLVPGASRTIARSKRYATKKGLPGGAPAMPSYHWTKTRGVEQAAEAAMARGVKAGIA